uniref:Uncharacterized protein n=1 Tax=Plectus sambesii TaxID=2011161 RepID=A0A914XRV3_9BILA
MTKESMQTAFDEIDTKFNDLKDQIGELESNINLRNTLRDARSTLDSAHFVFAALKLYVMHNETSARTEVSEQCQLHSPRNSLIALKNRATTTPRLFDEILTGTRYAQVLFEKISRIWLEEAGLCALLAQECDRILHHGASSALEKGRERAATENLRFIQDAYQAAGQKLIENYKYAVAADIREALRILDSKGYGRKQTAHFIHNHLSAKYSFRDWAVMVYNRIEFNQNVVHAHEGSMDNWFFIVYRRHTVIAHSSDSSMNCSFFESKFTNKTLRSFMSPGQDIFLSSYYSLVRKHCKTDSEDECKV